MIEHRLVVKGTKCPYCDKDTTGMYFVVCPDHGHLSSTEYYVGTHENCGGRIVIENIQRDCRFGQWSNKGVWRARCQKCRKEKRYTDYKSADYLSPDEKGFRCYITPAEEQFEEDYE